MRRVSYKKQGFVDNAHLNACTPIAYSFDCFSRRVIIAILHHAIHGRQLNVSLKVIIGVGILDSGEREVGRWIS
jgi:hypothetical protein